MAGMSRRGFLKLTASTGVFAATATASKAVERLIPYVIPPETIPPGVWALLATTCRECPAGCGMHLRYRDGRVTKAEGNPLSPVNRGALCPRGQSAVQGLYDPDRLAKVIWRERPALGTTSREVEQAEALPAPRTWEEAIEAISAKLRGEGRCVIISDLQTGMMSEIMEAFAATVKPSQLLFYEPFNYEPLRQAHQDVFGLSVVPDYRMDRCELVVSFAADFLESWISPVYFARQFAHLRTVRDGKIGRLAYAGPRLSMTAANADSFFKLPPGGEYWMAMAMLSVIVEKGWAARDVKAIGPYLDSFRPRLASPPKGVSMRNVEALARAFVRAKGSATLAGPTGAVGQTARHTAIAAALLNYVAGRVGQTVDFSRPHALGQTVTSAQLEQALSNLGRQDTVIIHQANLAYAAPALVESLRGAGTIIYMGTMMDETAQRAHWVLPIDSPLESWGDYEPVAGWHGLIQPTLARLYDTRAAGDIFLAVAATLGKPLAPNDGGTALASSKQWLRHRWQRFGKQSAGGDAEDFFRRCQEAGGLWQDAVVPANIALAPTVKNLRCPDQSLLPSMQPDVETAHLWAFPTVTLFDGRVANRSWLQEAPEPVSYAAWGSWADIHPAQACRFALLDGDMVELASRAGKVQVPVRVTDDVAEWTVAIAFGQGHTDLGRNAAGRGINAFLLLPDAASGTFGHVIIRKLDKKERIVFASATQEQHKRDLLRWTTLSKLNTETEEEGEEPVQPLPEGYNRDKDLAEPQHYKNHRWTMAIDLEQCIGCGACAVACYAENNVAVVGPDEMDQGRQMAWLRIIPYRHEKDSSRVGFLPMLCQQCDAAPCESVCPVYASVHNEEGLNAQVYNRCIGTRYCLNNCPYKVRRFNWLNHEWNKPLDMQLNPDVTVRSRGVMEKCTFCIQRIRSAQYQAKKERRKLRDGEIQTACAQTCPTGAIVFGDLLDEDSRVSLLTRRGKRRYNLLGELSTKPGIVYLKRIDADT
jgi:molybdopterin-containing oxidoreductase family iron-sulfur binding subunit